MTITFQGVMLVIIGVLLFGLIIFVHEFGHFITAKLSGVRVNEFAIGMGPQLFSFTRGETKYALRLLPIGGYCAMEGEDEESHDPHAFGSRPVWQRILVVAAGGIMNMLFAVVLMAVLVSQQSVFGSAEVAKFQENSALETAGVQVGDVITEINGYKIRSDEDISFALSVSSMELDPENPTIDLTVNRNGEKIVFDDMLVNTVDLTNGQKYIMLGIYVAPEEKTLLTVIKRSFTDTYSAARSVLYSLKGLVTGQFGMNDMAGPVGTAQAVSQVASEGLKRSFMDAVNNIIYIMLIISVNLGIVNLLPLPALDGGRLVFLFFELIFRKKVPAKYEGWVHAAGMVLLIGLMLVVTFNDVLRIVRG